MGGAVVGGFILLYCNQETIVATINKLLSYWDALGGGKWRGCVIITLNYL